jgi:hypothetical protein
VKGPNTASDGSGPLDVPSGAICRVILWDEHRHRQQEVSKIIVSTGTQPVIVGNSFDFYSIESSTECFAAAANTGAEAGGVGMQVIRALKTKGFKVIAYEDGAERWPIGTKCLPLLAGAVQLFDSSRPDFWRQLCETIHRLISVETQKQSDADNIKSIMRGLGIIGESAAMMTFSALLSGTARSAIWRCSSRARPARARKLSREPYTSWTQSAIKGLSSQ